MSDIEIMRDYIDARIMLLTKGAEFWLQQENEQQYNRNISKISELNMMLEVLLEMEEEL